MTKLHYGTSISATTAATDAQKPAAGKRSARIEAYGVKGFNSKPWRRTFRDADALLARCEEQSAEVYGQRFVEGG